MKKQEEASMIKGGSQMDGFGFDTDELRKNMEDDAMGAAFGGGFGGAFFDAMNIERASDDELIQMAEERGIDLDRYRN